MTTATTKRTVFDIVVRELGDLLIAQPHQILISFSSVILMGQFAGSSGILPGIVGYMLAIGIEWAYLRGLASDSRAPTRWGDVLNWSAFVIVVLWGILWVGERQGLLVEAQGAAGWALAAAHVVPTAWLSLCSAMTHGAAAKAEARQLAQRAEDERQRQLALDAEQRERERLAEERRLALAEDLERRRLEAELTKQQEDAAAARWVSVARAKAEIKAQSVTANDTVTLVEKVSRGVTTPSRDDLRRAIVSQIVTHRDSGEKLNVSMAAAALGISRAMFYKLRAEAVALGELEE